MAAWNLLGVKPEVIISGDAKRELIILPVVAAN